MFIDQTLGAQSTADRADRTRSERIDALLRAAAEHLREDHEAELIAYLRRNWPMSDLSALLDHERIEVVKTAAICLGLTGTFDESPALARALHHDDYFVVNIVERALWNIWFRASKPQCAQWLREAVERMHAEQYDDAEQLLDQILIADPAFAEACNQRAVLHYLTERFESSLMACRRTLALNPHHFGAAAGMGHNHAQLHNFADADDAYRQALHLHPRMEGVRQQMRRVREQGANDHPPASWRRPS
jgi:tetratricopeptide (TPR) repeat protein